MSLATGAPDGDRAYDRQDRRELLGLLSGRDLRVLELGCASGAAGAELKARGTAKVVHGVELRPDVAAEAERRIDRVWRADLETLEPGDLDPPYDAVVAADVLEHLRDPWSVLRRLSTALVGGAQLVASIPNVRYLPVVADLAVRGRFDYRPEGVLDRTHLRFFTRRSVHDLLGHAGFVDVVIDGRPLSRRWKRMLAGPLGDLGVRQFLIHARLGPSAGEG